VNEEKRRHDVHLLICVPEKLLQSVTELLGISHKFFLPVFKNL